MTVLREALVSKNILGRVRVPAFLRKSSVMIKWNGEPKSSLAPGNQAESWECFFFIPPSRRVIRVEFIHILESPLSRWSKSNCVCHCGCAQSQIWLGDHRAWIRERWTHPRRPRLPLLAAVAGRTSVYVPHIARRRNGRGRSVCDGKFWLGWDSSVLSHLHLKGRHVSISVRILFWEHDGME